MPNFPRSFVRPLLALAQMSSSQSTNNPPRSVPYKIKQYQARHSEWPYSEQDFRRMDVSPDSNFYRQPRFVTHIDDGAIEGLRQYYEQNLPRTGRILDLCSSWISHLPESHENLVRQGELALVGVGLNREELDRNPMLKSDANTKGGGVVQDLNQNPTLGQDISQEALFDSVTCVVSIDYLTQPLQVLRSAKQVTKKNGFIHLAISNRCFPSKAIARWLRITEQERLEMVGDYLWFAGWKQIEIVQVVEAGAGWLGLPKDPLWVVRGQNVE